MTASSKAIETAAAMMTLGQTEDIESMGILYDELDDVQRKALTFFLAGLAFNALVADAKRQNVPVPEAIRRFAVGMAVVAENIRSSGK